MTYQVIARKYRPQTFVDVIGQEHITKTLQNAFSSGRLHHAYLLTGIRGIGKTTLARIFSKLLNCQAPVTKPTAEPCNKCQSCISITNGSSIDVQEIDGASNTGVDDVREIRERVKFLPSVGKYKIYIIDEVHMLSTGAFNALLKTLEEPPKHVVFIFATTEVHKIPATILSRCQRYDFRRITDPKIVETLKQIAKGETVTAEDGALDVIAEEAEGSMRDAESLFDQAIAFSGKNLTLESLKQLLGFLDKRQLHDAVQAIATKDASKVLKISDDLFMNGENLGRFSQDILRAFHDLLIVKSCKEIPESIKAFDVELLKELSTKVSIEECQQWFDLAYRGVEDIARSKTPKMLLDVLLINMTQVRPVRSVDELLEKVEAMGKQTADNRQQTTDSNKLNVESKQLNIEPRTLNHGPEPEQRTETSAQTFEDFVDWLKLNKPQVASFLEMGVLGEIRGSEIIVKFKNKFACERLSENDKKEFLEKLALDFFKKPMKLKAEFERGHDEDVLATKRRANEETAVKHRTVKEETLKHDVVREAANIFGAEIKEIKVK